MNILIYGSKSDQQILVQCMSTLASTAFRTIHYSQTDDYDKFLEYLKVKDYEMVFIMMDNAAGMEGVVAAQDMQPYKPVIWFSNDKNFVAQSYRLGVTYFAVKPISEKILNLAIARCQ